MKQAFFPPLISICTVWRRSIYSAFQSLVQSRLLLHLNEISALIRRRSSFLVSDRKAKRWWRNMGAKNVRGNVKPLACVSVCPGPSTRAQASQGTQRHWGACLALKTCLASFCRRWLGPQGLNTAFLISIIFTASHLNRVFICEAELRWLCLKGNNSWLLVLFAPYGTYQSNVTAQNM